MSIYSAAILADSPFAYYRLGESSGTTAADSSGNAKDGTYEGSPTLGAAGLLSGDADTAVTLNGTTQDVLLPSDVLNIAGATDGFSMEAWFKTTMSGNGGIIDARNSTNDDPMLTLTIQSGQLHYEIRDPGRHGTLIANLTDSVFNDGVRHHVVMTRDSSKVWRIYIDGVIVVQTTADGMTMATGGITSMDYSYIGWERLNNWRFNGTIDEVAVWHSTLTAAQVANHYTIGSMESAEARDPYSAIVLSDTPAAYYRLGETGGMRAVDASGNGQHGALRNGAAPGATGLLTSSADMAVPLDGTNDRIDVPTDTAALASATSPLTIEAWIKTTSAASTKGIYCARNWTSLNPLIQVYMTSGTIVFRVRDNGGAGFTAITSPGTVNDGNAHHVVATLDTSKQMRLYLDGALVVGPTAHAMTSATTGLSQSSIGEDRSDATIAPWAGTIDEVAIYQRTLSVDAIRAHYNAGISAFVPATWLDNFSPLLKANGAASTPISDSDSATLAEASQPIQIAKTDTDSSSLADLISALAVTLTDTEAQSAAEAVSSIAVSSTDALSGADAGSVSQTGTSPSDAEMFTLAETNAIAAALSDTFSATLSETQTAVPNTIAKSDSDSATLSELQTNASGGIGIALIGVSVGFGDNAYTASPTWTRLDDPVGVS